MSLNKLVEARAHFETIIETYAEFAEAHNKLATVLCLLGEYKNPVSG